MSPWYLDCERSNQPKRRPNDQALPVPAAAQLAGDLRGSWASSYPADRVKNGRKKRPTRRLAFLSPEAELLLLGGCSGSSGVFGGGASGSSRSGFSGLGFGGRSSSRSFSGGSSRGSRCNSGGSGGRSFNGLRLFLLAAGGNSECNESSNQERLFHCWFPLSINEVQKLKFISNQVGEPDLVRIVSRGKCLNKDIVALPQQAFDCQAL